MDKASIAADDCPSVVTSEYNSLPPTRCVDWLAPAAIALDRFITSEAHQFPELALACHENANHARELIADIFSNAMRDGQIRSIDTRFAAEQFLYAVVDGPARTAILSGKTARSEKDLRERVTAAVGLFLDGCRDRTARP